MSEKKSTTEQKSADLADMLGGNVDEDGGATKHGKPVMETTEEDDGKDGKD
ncbi:hypothetical protein [Terricaulis sp.]|uniref:hypothetical protein n=1 Tax=Terricaulis sp. TaxID=2768686 RepID=UPI002AC7E3DB|nr:hypothetical protein [Terricaulis sp.]MDZ4692266.1 hypothetical protein [Terricaulis sp.]